MLFNKNNKPRSIKGIILLSCALLFSLWFAMMAYSWVNIQKLESNHKIEDILQKIILKNYMILKAVDEALLTNGTIPPLIIIQNKSKELDLLLDTLKNNYQNNNLISSSLEHITEDRIKLNKKLTLLLEWPDDISISNPGIMMIAGNITAIGESMLIKLEKLKKQVNYKFFFAKKNIQTSIGLTALLAVIASFLIFIFLYKSITNPFNTLLNTTRTLEIEKAVAEKANLAKSKFLSRMSHELRTPMNAILGFGQILDLNPKDLNDTQKSNVKEILNAGHHLLGLINEMLDLAKIESGKMEISLEEVKVDDLLQHCISLVKVQADARHLQLIDHVSSKGHILQTDFTRLKQVLLNLLSNAVKYNREHGSITLNSTVIDQQHLRISITDQGKGLTNEEISKLFTPFERLNHLNNVEGTGIGLVISKHLVELMGGRIGIDSIPGEGSTFWLELSLA